MSRVERGDSENGPDALSDGVPQVHWIPLTRGANLNHVG
jgi:hypothetical protein